ncbi:DUF1761 domain-containing protein [Pseudidiomarina insulisalsae]|uniref:DUF1761 domain-containing protein n=1 Tax=Pseudidiomarina insulisalsae TaxID=575789 RepID=A0A432YQW0_9GAMM|nr:DUF1761 domain-containing protein [Pseudidiomarina insulisalsae]RUO63748.1 DUF1761 domain-containing protein [Pseudidiomarina insulisalsae]
METMGINYAAVAVASLMNLVLGGLWYSPLLFAKVWERSAGMTEGQLKRFNPAKVLTLTLVLSWVICLNLAFFLAAPGTDWQWGMTAGFLAGFGWAAMIFIVISLFEQRSLAYMLVHAGYITVYFTLAGLIIGAWQ